MLYEGKAKQIYATDDQTVVRIQYKDEATAFNGEKKEQLAGKGEMNNCITSILFEYLHEKGIQTHFIRRISATEQLVKRLKMIPLEVVVRNQVAGSLVKRLGLAEGTKLNQPIIEYYLKDDRLGDPLINHDHIATLRIIDPNTLADIRELALNVNEYLHKLFWDKGMVLVDFKLEYGIDEMGDVMLGDEISPDTCRLWDRETGDKLDKDRFRRDLGDVVKSYQIVWKRLGGTQHV
ncbi:phosphoribosylaminoimidazolesuccinocarboxamide synthase [Hazenella sp. IB182357]|uniref:Phosphoribosylaminoimidazole-succinocarboxamide synthase n=1 Tax=Polycladospora coralii TaxID=2771432 RepID=A0A926RYB3_9BACL|nr:phosphoribosylaminoimidazolesuccinocarboxamide synthase [Polycladospora coralii]MBD1373351.1 phosphoribosylaminoimidazolesuccinocarboxamide synthase [Polycladospora coralii]MBS7531650.1 phosphoribosylaminoimidazolesuccinocarboxamide synthase [Polycladospora coralii]